MPTDKEIKQEFKVKASKDPDKYYVVGFDAQRQILIVGPETSLYRTELMATQTNWIRPQPVLHGFKCKAQIRSRHVAAACRVTLFENDTVHVEFDDPQRAITPGQAIVFFDGDEALGGAFIISASGVKEHSKR